MHLHIDVSFNNNTTYPALSRITCLQGIGLVHSCSTHSRKVPRLYDTALRIPPHPTSLRVSVWTTRCSCCSLRIASRNDLSTTSETNFWYVPANIILRSTLWPISYLVRPSPYLSHSIVITIWFIKKCDFCNCVTVNAVQVSYASWNHRHISGLVRISYVKWVTKIPIVEPLFSVTWKFFHF